MASLNLGGSSVFYEDSGSGDPVVLIHGAASSGRSFAEHASILSCEFRTVIPDLRGMGRSSHVSALPPNGWTEELCALLDDLEIERAHLCGTSLGARIALRLAIDHPARVSTVVADSPIVADSLAQSAAFERAFGSEMTRELAEQLNHWNGTDWRAIVTNYMTLREQEGLQDYYDLRDALRDLECPVLVTRGDIDDEIHPLAHAVEVHSRAPLSALWIFPSTPFSVARYRPVEFVERVRQFIKAARPIRGGESPGRPSSSELSSEWLAPGT